MIASNYYRKNAKGVFLKGNIPSLKNSKEIQVYKKWIPDPNDPTSKILKQFNRLGYSKSVDKYLKEYEDIYMQAKVDIMNLFKGDEVWHIGFYFCRDSRRKFDFNNVTQIIQDLFVKYNYISDDNMTALYPYPLGYELNTSEPGVWIYNVKNLIPLEALIRHYDTLSDNIIKETNGEPTIEFDNALRTSEFLKTLIK